MYLQIRDEDSIPLSLTFDDCDMYTYNEIYPILKKFGIKATFYIVTNQISRPGKMTFEELKYLHKEGNEIGSHTHTHPHLTNLSDKKLDIELKKSKSILKQFGCKTLAYPFGVYNRKVIKYAQRYYFAARSYYDMQINPNNFGFNHGLIHERFKLNVFPTECVFPNQSLTLLEMNISELKKVFNPIISNAIKSKFWSIFVFHGPNHSPSKFSNSSYTNPGSKPFIPIRKSIKKMIYKKKWIRNFKYICKSLASNNQLKVLPVSKVIEIFS